MKKPLLIALASIAALALVAWATGMGTHPRYRYYGMDVELSVHGQVVTLSGDLECARTRSGINTGWQTTYGRARPLMFAARLDDGQVVAVKTANYCLSDIPADASDYVPSVFLFDGGDPPARIDAYVDPVYLRDPESKVHVRRVSFTPLRGSAFGEFSRKAHQASSAADLVPWANAPAYQNEHGPHWFYRGYMVDSVGFDSPGAGAALARVEWHTDGYTRLDYDSEYGRETLRHMQDHESGRLGMRIDWADPDARCRRNPDDYLCHVLTRQRPLRFEIEEGRHVMDVPPELPRGPLRLQPISGGPPPRYLNKLGYSGDEEIGDKFPATLILGENEIDMPHDFVSKYTLAVTIDWANERVFRVFMMELEPSLFDER